MKRGVSFFTFDEDVNIKEAMEQCKKAGYDGVELTLGTNSELNMNTTEKELLGLKKTAHDMGLEICSIGAWNVWENNLASGDEQERNNAKDNIKRQIDIAQACGADTALVVPGWVGTPFTPTVVSYDLAYERVQNALASLSDYAKNANVVIAIENVWNKFLLSPLEMKCFLDGIDSKYVSAYFDIGNIIYIGYPEQWIRILGKRIRRLQFCDCRFGQSGWGMFVDLLEGDVDYEEVMHAIKDIGYDDWAVVEFFPNYKRFKYQSIINAKYSMDTILNIK